MRIDLNLPLSSQNQQNNFQFRPLPTLGSTSTDHGFAASSNRPKMNLPTIPKKTIDPVHDKTRYDYDLFICIRIFKLHLLNIFKCSNFYRFYNYRYRQKHKTKSR